ncbi:MAG TPA: hypothetical protein VEP67_07660 [Thiobacillaceae bacterium]|nr:hypothetical protein [Thiobacillaceae bacterium]
MTITKHLSIMRLGAVALMAMALAGCGGGGGGGGGKTSSSSSSSTGGPPPVADPALVAQAKPEQCILCHTATATGADGHFGSVAKTGPLHFADYKQYADSATTGKFTLVIDSVSSVLNGAGPTYTSTLTFHGTDSRSGASVPLTAAMVKAFNQKTFYAVPYDTATRTFGQSFSYSVNTAADAAGNTITVTNATAPFAPEQQTAAGVGAQAYAYIADGVIDTEGMTLYGAVANAGKAYGDAGTYASAANVSACETCHGKPYMKHGYRMAHVTNGPNPGLADFGGCKDCHYDSRDGHDLNWQILKDDPARAAEIAGGSPITAAEQTKYAYKAKVMNDVHMSHNMEFPYPQTMQSCTTCHAGHLGDTLDNDIFADSKYVASTCVSCHSVDGLKAKMQKRHDGVAITIHDSFLAKMDDPAQRDTVVCTTCHGKAVGVGPSFATIHNNGYDAQIYATDGTRYASAGPNDPDPAHAGVFAATIDSATYDATTHMLDIKFSATGTLGSLDAANIKPTILIGLYGYDTKDFIVAAHGSAADGRRNLEHVWGDGNPRFTDVSASGGSWEVKADLSLWADKLAANADGTVVVRRAEIAVLPQLTAQKRPLYPTDTATVTVGLNAPSKTFNFAANAFEDYFPALVNVFKTPNANTNGSLDGCNTCHDQLATTFHSGIRGGNIRVCRICHEVSNGGSHLEAQSRSIDSYVHAIHSFQVFDQGDINPDDPVQMLEFEDHISHHFPRFTIKDCEACHVNSSNIYVAGRKAYDVPNQSKSMPGVLSGTDTIENRDIGPVAPAVTGPAVRACGACHRAQAINTDDEGRLSTMIAHWQTFGYYIETTSDAVRTLWQAVVDKMMALFKNDHA